MGVVLNSILPPLAVIQPRGFESILLSAFQVEVLYLLAQELERKVGNHNRRVEQRRPYTDHAQR